MRGSGAGPLSSASAAGPSAPPSPTMSAVTTATNIGVSSNRLPPYLINRADLRTSLSTYDGLLAASKTYTKALLALGTASSELATALESCSRLKGAHDVCTDLLAASGIHHMAGNAFSILADSFWKEASIPLLEHHDLYVRACADRTVQHERAIQTKSKALQEAEKRNQKNARGKSGRDLHSFRQALLELQRHVDDLDEEKARYYSEVLEGEEECWTFVQGKMMGALRCQLDTHERISSKGMSDPILEPILASIPDPFSAYGPPSSDDKIFTILSQGVLQGTSDVEYESENQQTAAGLDAADGPRKVANLIMSPGTPSKGLSRVTSGNVSPRLAQEEDGSHTDAVRPNDPSNASQGLGISLTAAAEHALNGTKPCVDDVPKVTKVAGKSGEPKDSSTAELFGTDGEDDGGDEASLFSGTEDDDGRGALSMATTTGDEGVSSDGRSAQQPGIAARIIAEKKQRRERAVRANAKTRLKHALSTIEESKTPTIRLSSQNRQGNQSTDKNPRDAHNGSFKNSASPVVTLGPRDMNASALHDINDAGPDQLSDHESKRAGSDASEVTLHGSQPHDSSHHDREAHALWD